MEILLNLTNLFYVLAILGSGLCLWSAYILYRLAGLGYKLGVWYYIAGAMLLMAIESLLPLFGKFDVSGLNGQLIVVVQFVIALGIFIGLRRSAPTLGQRGMGWTKGAYLPNSLDVVTYSTNAESVVEFVSPAILNVLGYTPDEAIGRPVGEFFQADMRGTNTAIHLTDILRTNDGHVSQHRVLMKRKDNSTAACEMSATMKTGPAGEFLGTEGILRDITSLVAMEEELRTQTAIVNEMPLAVCLLDRYTFEMRWVNNTCNAFLGFEPGQLIGKSALDFNRFMAEDRKIDDSVNVLRHLEQHGLWSGRTSARRQDGSRLATSTTLSLIDHPSYGQCILWVAVDGSKAERTEAELFAMESRYANLLAQTPFCIYEIDLEGKMISVSQAGRDLMGIKGELLPKTISFMGCVCNEDKIRVTKLMQSAFSGEEAEGSFESIYGPTLKSNFVPIKDQFGQVERVMGIAMPIAKADEAQAVLVKH
ncbi:PAS domain S-box protein [bacterium]|nr:PAS domain S-box protein [bacterium]